MFEGVTEFPAVNILLHVIVMSLMWEVAKLASTWVCSHCSLLNTGVSQKGLLGLCFVNQFFRTFSVTVLLDFLANCNQLCQITYTYRVQGEVLMKRVVFSPLFALRRRMVHEQHVLDGISAQVY